MNEYVSLHGLPDQKMPSDILIYWDGQILPENKNGPPSHCPNCGGEVTINPAAQAVCTSENCDSYVLWTEGERNRWHIWFSEFPPMYDDAEYTPFRRPTYAFKLNGVDPDEFIRVRDALAAAINWLEGDPERDAPLVPKEELLWLNEVLSKATNICDSPKMGKVR